MCQYEGVRRTFWSYSTCKFMHFYYRFYWVATRCSIETRKKNACITQREDYSATKKKWIKKPELTFKLRFEGELSVEKLNRIEINRIEINRTRFNSPKTKWWKTLHYLKVEELKCIQKLPNLKCPYSYVASE